MDMPDSFTDRNVENVKDVNRHIVESRGESFGLDDPTKFYDVFREVNGFYSIEDPKMRLIKKAATLLSGLVWGQPFKNGNKATATAITKYFLKKNGYFFVLQNDEEEKEFFNLLERTVEKFEGDPTIYSEIEKYLIRKVIKI